MNTESNHDDAAGEAIVAEAVTALEVTERSIIESGLLIVRNTINTGRNIGMIIINGDLGEAIRQSANHMS